MNILDKIVAQKQLEVAASKELISIEELKTSFLFT
jgi:indole-3-glycerol phosphate synthase